MTLHTNLKVIYFVLWEKRFRNKKQSWLKIGKTGGLLSYPNDTPLQRVERRCKLEANNFDHRWWSYTIYGYYISNEEEEAVSSEE